MAFELGKLNRLSKWKSSIEKMPDWDIVVAYIFSGSVEKVSEEN